MEAVVQPSARLQEDALKNIIVAVAITAIVSRESQRRSSMGGLSAVRSGVRPTAPSRARAYARGGTRDLDLVVARGSGGWNACLGPGATDVNEASLRGRLGAVSSCPRRAASSAMQLSASFDLNRLRARRDHRMGTLRAASASATSTRIASERVTTMSGRSFAICSIV